MLQIADMLANGAGFCQRLTKNIGGSTALIIELIDSILNSLSNLMVNVFLKARIVKIVIFVFNATVIGSTYGLLDWRLGRSFLRCLFDPTYRVGLDGNFTQYSELEDWPELAKIAA